MKPFFNYLSLEEAFCQEKKRKKEKKS